MHPAAGAIRRAKCDVIGAQYCTGSGRASNSACEHGTAALSFFFMASAGERNGP